MTRFLITGTTGRLGGAILDSLSATVDAADIHPLVRSDAAAAAFAARGFSPRVGDYDDPASLDAALSGIDRLLFVSSPVHDPAVRVRQHTAVTDAAASARVEHIVYTSAMGASHDPGHSTTERALADGRIAHTILRNGLYTEPFATKALAEAAGGPVVGASGGRRLATASILDLAEAAARSLLVLGEGSTLELRGPAWSFDELGAAVGEALARSVEVREVEDHETGPFAVLFPLVRKGFYDAETADLEHLLGRPPRGIREVVADLVG